MLVRSRSSRNARRGPFVQDQIAPGLKPHGFRYKSQGPPIALEPPLHPEQNRGAEFLAAAVTEIIRRAIGKTPRLDQKAGAIDIGHRAKQDEAPVEAVLDIEADPEAFALVIVGPCRDPVGRARRDGRTPGLTLIGEVELNEISRADKVNPAGVFLRGKPGEVRSVTALQLQLRAIDAIESLCHRHHAIQP